MQTVKTQTVNLQGTSYEIGRKFGEWVGAIPPLAQMHTAGMAGFGAAEAREAMALFDRWCPGLTEELRGFADALSVVPERVVYYAMTYLRPRCSQIALLPSVTEEGKPLVARNYEFNHEMEDFCLIKTRVEGKYTHMGTSVIRFGREDGVNECGLSVTMSSCGFPVGAQPFMRAPKIKGLMFWAVIRALLENCADVEEAIAYVRDMPIAYNLNLIVADKAGNAALIETLDGEKAVKRIGPDTKEQMLAATNHVLLPELMPDEPEVMLHSIKRYDYIKRQLAGKVGITRETLKDMLLSKYPEGLCCHYYEEYFGTTKSMVISPKDGTIELNWGGRKENGWQLYDINQPLEDSVREVQINLERAAPSTYESVPRP